MVVATFIECRSSIAGGALRTSASGGGDTGGLGRAREHPLEVLFIHVITTNNPGFLAAMLLTLLFTLSAAADEEKNRRPDQSPKPRLG